MCVKRGTLSTSGSACAAGCAGSSSGDEGGLVFAVESELLSVELEEDDLNVSVRASPFSKSSPAIVVATCCGAGCCTRVS